MRSDAFFQQPPGWFSGVALGRGRGYLIATVWGGELQPQTIRVFAWQDMAIGSATEMYRASLREGAGFGRIDVVGGHVWIAFVDGSTITLRNISTGEQRTFAGENNNPVCFGNGFFAWQGLQRDGWPVSRMNLASGVVAEHVRAGSGTGLSRILPDGFVVLMDEDRLLMPGAVKPQFAGDLIVGEHPDNRGVIWQLGAVRGGLWSDRAIFDPDCAVDGELVAICAAAGPGVFAFCGTRAELLSFAGQSDEPKDQPKDEPKDEPKEEPTVSDPKSVPQPIIDSLSAARAQFPSGPDVRLTPEQIGKVLNDGTWPHRGAPYFAGLQAKSASSTHAVLPDGKGTTIWNGIRFRTEDGRHWGADVCGACSVGRFEVVNATPGPATAESFVDPVAPSGEEPGDGGTKPDPKPDPELEARLAALEATVAGLRGDQAATGQELVALKKTVDGIDLAGVAHKGDAVTVTGNVFGYRVTGHGSIDQ